MNTILLIYAGISATLTIAGTARVILKMRGDARRHDNALLNIGAVCAASLFWPIALLVELAWSHMQSPRKAHDFDQPRPKVTWERAEG